MPLCSATSHFVCLLLDIVGVKTKTMLQKKLTSYLELRGRVGGNYDPQHPNLHICSNIKILSRAALKKHLKGNSKKSDTVSICQLYTKVKCKTTNFGFVKRGGLQKNENKMNIIFCNLCNL